VKFKLYKYKLKCTQQNEHYQKNKGYYVYTQYLLHDLIFCFRTISTCIPTCLNFLHLHNSFMISIFATTQFPHASIFCICTSPTCLNLLYLHNSYMLKFFVFAQLLHALIFCICTISTCFVFLSNCTIPTWFDFVCKCTIPSCFDFFCICRISTCLNFSYLHKSFMIWIFATAPF